MKKSLNPEKLEQVAHDGILPARVFYFKKEGDMLAEVILPHMHRDIELGYLISGNTRMNINGRSEEVSEGEVILVNSEDVHSSYRSSVKEEAESIALLIDCDFIKRYFKNIGQIPFTETFSPEQPAFLTAHLRKIVDLYNHKSVFYSLEATDVMLRIILYLLKNCTDPLYKAAPCRKNTHNLNKAIDFINENYAQAVSLKDVADHLNLDEEYFSRRFHEVMGIRFRDYLQLKRLNMACTQMYNANVTVTEAAFGNGFPNLKSFIAIFKKYYNMTPKQYARICSAAASGNVPNQDLVKGRLLF